MLTSLSSTLGNVVCQSLWILALVGAVGIGALEHLVVAGTGAWLWVNAGKVLLDVWVLVEALEELARCSWLAMSHDDSIEGVP